MRIVYHSVNNLCPVKDYLRENFVKTKILVELSKKIEHIGGLGIARPPIAKPLIGYSFFEILQSDKDKNIRILFSISNKKMVLLHAFDKPKNYNNSKVDKK